MGDGGREIAAIGALGPLQTLVDVAAICSKGPKLTDAANCMNDSTINFLIH